MKKFILILIVLLILPANTVLSKYVKVVRYEELDVHKRKLFGVHLSAGIGTPLGNLGYELSFSPLKYIRLEGGIGIGLMYSLHVKTMAKFLFPLFSKKNKIFIASGWGGNHLRELNMYSQFIPIEIGHEIFNRNFSCLSLSVGMKYHLKTTVQSHSTLAASDVDEDSLNNELGGIFKYNPYVMLSYMRKF